MEAKKIVKLYIEGSNLDFDSSKFKDILTGKILEERKTAMRNMYIVECNLEDAKKFIKNSKSISSIEDIGYIA